VVMVEGLVGEGATGPVALEGAWLAASAEPHGTGGHPPRP
jgi:hypothetical protein